jgi:hypothetical protein
MPLGLVPFIVVKAGLTWPWSARYIGESRTRTRSPSAIAVAVVVAAAVAVAAMTPRNWSLRRSSWNKLTMVALAFG